MIYHYYDPWRGVKIWNVPADTSPTWTTTNYPANTRWKSTSGLRPITQPDISVVKSDKFTTLVIRDDNENIVIVVDLSTEEATDLARKLTNDNNS